MPVAVVGIPTLPAPPSVTLLLYDEAPMACHPGSGSRGLGGGRGGILVATRANRVASLGLGFHVCTCFSAVSS